ncbi:unnamed protein product [Arctogadus glacialis]
MLSLSTVQSLNSLNDQIASFMVSGPKALEQEEPAFLPTEKDTLQKSMTLMRRLLVDAQVMTPPCHVNPLSMLTRPERLWVQNRLSF